MKLIVGLGNPGAEYEKTRHNVGFMFADAFAKKHGLSFLHKSKFNAETADFVFEGEKFMLCKPQTYMNLSGNAVSEIMNFYKINISDLFVVFDDFSLPVGKMRFRANGSDGGHNGIKSIILRTGSSDFARLKIGLGSPKFKSAVVNYVLGGFSSEEADTMKDVIDVSVKAVEEYFKYGINFVQNKYN